MKKLKNIAFCCLAIFLLVGCSKNEKAEEFAKKNKKQENQIESISLAKKMITGNYDITTYSEEVQKKIKESNQYKITDLDGNGEDDLILKTKENVHIFLWNKNTLEYKDSISTVINGEDNSIFKDPKFYLFNNTELKLEFKQNTSSDGIEIMKRRNLNMYYSITTKEYVLLTLQDYVVTGTSKDNKIIPTHVTQSIVMTNCSDANPNVRTVEMSEFNEITKQHEVEGRQLIEFEKFSNPYPDKNKGSATDEDNAITNEVISKALSAGKEEWKNAYIEYVRDFVKSKAESIQEFNQKDNYIDYGEDNFKIEDNYELDTIIFRGYKLLKTKNSQVPILLVAYNYTDMDSIFIKAFIYANDEVRYLGDLGKMSGYYIENAYVDDKNNIIITNIVSGNGMVKRYDFYSIENDTLVCDKAYHGTPVGEGNEFEYYNHDTLISEEEYDQIYSNVENEVYQSIKFYNYSQLLKEIENL